MKNTQQCTYTAITYQWLFKLTDEKTPKNREKNAFQKHHQENNKKLEKTQKIWCTHTVTHLVLFFVSNDLEINNEREKKTRSMFLNINVSCNF